MTDQKSADKKQMKFSTGKSAVLPGAGREETPWKILIVDDEKIIHTVTELVLREFRFEQRGLMILSAYGELQARQLLNEHADIAVALVDIVMEEDNSGLNLIRWIREDRGNQAIRLILRTGQPGIAPEKDIIQRYEINDYKEKTELTDVKLITALTVAIRGYRDLIHLQRNQQGYERIVRGAGAFWEGSGRMAFLDEILFQFSRIVVTETENRLERDCLSLQKQENSWAIRKGTGRFSDCTGRGLEELESGLPIGLLEESGAGNRILYETPWLVCSLDTRQTEGVRLVMRSGERPDRTDFNILGAFLVNASLALDYGLLTVSRSRSQKKMLYFLSEIIEHHFMETGNHIRRVSEMMHVFCRRQGLSEEDAERWKMASILHDLGKIGIPDHILKKPGRLTPEEYEVMKGHVLIGHKLLSSNEDEFFPDAAEIALYHHEKWDGAGYPHGLKMEDIPFPARMLAIIDVFDALTHKRIYKDAWTVDRALEFISSRKNEDFDPALVDLFISIVPDLRRILDDYPD